MTTREYYINYLEKIKVRNSNYVYSLLEMEYFPENMDEHLKFLFHVLKSNNVDLLDTYVKYVPKHLYCGEYVFNADILNHEGWFDFTYEFILHIFEMKYADINEKCCMNDEYEAGVGTSLDFLSYAYHSQCEFFTIELWKLIPKLGINLKKLRFYDTLEIFNNREQHKEFIYRLASYGVHLTAIYRNYNDYEVAYIMDIVAPFGTNPEYSHGLEHILCKYRHYRDQNSSLIHRLSKPMEFPSKYCCDTTIIFG